VCDKHAVKKIFQQEPIDSVMHFAGLKAVGESVKIPLRYYRVNLGAAISLLEAMTEHKIYKLVFSSSATVYGRVDISPIGEDADLGSGSPYGWTKYMIEQILRDTQPTDPKWSIALMRYFNPVGAHPSGLLGEYPSGEPNNLMPRAIEAAYSNTALGVFGNDYPTDDGTCVRDYIHVTDLARGHAGALRYLDSHSGCHAFNLGTGIGYSVLDIIRAVERASGARINYTVEPRRTGDAPRYFADAGKANRRLNWMAEKTLDDMCRDAWNFKIKNPEGY
jgi:UDP-glucose 4-epimerase